MSRPDFHHRSASGGSRMHSLQRWLWRTQRWPRGALRTYQAEHLVRLLKHAAQTVPFYANRLQPLTKKLSASFNVDDWMQIPVLTRRDIQLAGTEIHSDAVPAAHGDTFCTFTGGSTGQPVRTIGTARTAYIWQALAIRDHIWHDRDLSRKLASIRHTTRPSTEPPLGKVTSSWGPSVAPFLKTGPAAILSINSTVEQQADWLVRERPAYLLSYPSCIQALANHFSSRGRELPGLIEVRTFGEILEPNVRTAAQIAWGTPVVDLYSSQELGYVALQCPGHTHYHVQEESVLVEVLRDDGTRCRPGEVGQVVVTSLHNYAMPLIRYQVGDFAELGERCTCGRNLLVLKRILGRQRNMLVLPNGSLVWPALNVDRAHGALESLNSVNQMQVVQTSLQELEVNLVSRERLAPKTEQALLQFIDQCLPARFQVKLQYVDAISRSPSGKFEDFRSEVGLHVPQVCPATEE